MNCRTKLKIYLAGPRKIKYPVDFMVKGLEAGPLTVKKDMTVPKHFKIEND